MDVDRTTNEETLHVHNDDATPIRPDHPAAPSPVSAEAILAALNGDLTAYARLHDPTGQRPTDQKEIDRFLMRGGPRLMGALKQLGYLGITVDPNSKFAQRVTQFWVDVEAATNGDVGAYLRLSLANGDPIHPEDVLAFIDHGGPPVDVTARQRELLGLKTDPTSPFGQRLGVWRLNGHKEPGPAKNPTPARPTTPAGGAGASDNAPQTPQPPAHEPIGPAHSSPDTSTPDTSTPPASTPTRSIQVGWQIGGDLGDATWDVSYQDGTLTTTETRTNIKGDVTSVMTTTVSGDAAQQGWAGAVALQAQRDADDKAHYDAVIKDAARQKELLDEAAAEQEAKDAAQDASVDPDPEGQSAHRKPDATEDGSPGPVRITNEPPPQGPAGQSLAGGDFGNPMYAEYVGGTLVVRVSAGPEVNPDAGEGDVTVSFDDPAPTAPRGRLPFGGDFGNPLETDGTGTAHPLTDPGNDPYA